MEKKKKKEEKEEFEEDPEPSEAPLPPEDDEEEEDEELEDDEGEDEEDDDEDGGEEEDDEESDEDEEEMSEVEEKKGKKGKKKKKEKEDTPQGEKLAPFALYLGIFTILCAIIGIAFQFLPAFIACFLCFVRFIIGFGWLTFFVGIALGIVSLALGAGKNKSKAIIGIVLNALAPVAWILYFIIRLAINIIF